MGERDNSEKNISVSGHESLFNEENMTKDIAEPAPNKLPPISTFSLKTNNFPVNIEGNFYNQEVNNVFNEFVNMKKNKVLTEIGSKEELRTSEYMNCQEDQLPNMPHNESNKGFYTKYMGDYKNSTLLKKKKKKKQGKIYVDLCAKLSLCSLNLLMNIVNKNKSQISENTSHDTFKKYWNQFFGR